jgi:hypothetical protein
LLLLLGAEVHKTWPEALVTTIEVITVTQEFPTHPKALEAVAWLEDHAFKGQQLTPEFEEVSKTQPLQSGSVWQIEQHWEVLPAFTPLG